ncbi:uncharacterized protein LOC132613370 [Lycium barbarum]|uniref:uncharacterized protein LOC132613370 n=1 Tax=Lycium barbarum TaxID=112863 RepID=UPI00293E218D|nr:uncharacterized protein LOC132613370 [Lycium barbarum]
MEKKIEGLLKRSNRATRKSTGLRYGDLCMHPNLDLPEGFKIPKFEMFNGIGNPKAHLHSYCDQLVGVKKKEPLIMRLFSLSLTGEAAEWFVTQYMGQWLTWEDIAESFMEWFRFNDKIVPNRYYLEKVKQKSTENYREFPSQWRAEAARVQPQMCEGELVSVFIRSQELDFYDRMLSMAGRPFAEFVKMGEAIEDALKSSKIISVLNKASNQAPAGVFCKKTKDVASISHILSRNPKRREEPQSSHQNPPPINYPASPYSPAPIFYAQLCFITTVPAYVAPLSVRGSAPTYQPPPQQTCQPPQQNY